MAATKVSLKLLVDVRGQKVLFAEAEDPKATCPMCRNTMNSQVQLVETDQKKASSSTYSLSEGEGGYVRGVVTYMVTDDLMVKPMSAISSIALLNRLNVKDVEALEEKTINFGMDEAVKLLKHRCSRRLGLLMSCLGRGQMSNVPS
ncbi:hypothetical protein REPUB_Repub03eG0199700 [Reevesia pubescens]